MPATVESLVDTGTVTLFAVVFLGIEVLVLVLFARHRILPILANGLSGLFLILALHAALVGRGTGTIALCLALGGLAHVADLVLRLRR